MNCPYNVPHVDREVGHSVKCDGCASRVAEGRTLFAWTLVAACSRLRSDRELKEKYEGVAGSSMPDPSITHPNIIIKKCPAALEPADLTGKVTNTQGGGIDHGYGSA